MYNRYIPQPDGSHRRDPAAPRPTPPPPSAPPPKPPSRDPVTGFLRQLLPRGFDTGDLIIVLLLLLIAGDNREARSNALLTVALYFVL